MKILILTVEYLRSSKTGDCTQTICTIQALRDEGHEVEVRYMSNNTIVEESSNLEYSKEKFEDYLLSFDIVHILPPNYRWIKRNSRILKNIPVALSTVYWNNWSRIIMTLRNSSNIKDALASSFFMFVSGLKCIMNFSSSIDIFLPNSSAEAYNLKKHFRLTSKNYLFPVPNAIDTSKFVIKDLVRPNVVPVTDYIVCPGVFAPRKNQLGLIKSLKKYNINIPVVFLGGQYDGDSKYYDKCRKMATSNMIFLGYVANDTELYWSTLKFARCACLTSDCETPAIALLEAAACGARPIVTKYGGTFEYYGFTGEYFNPLNSLEIALAIKKGFERGRLSTDESNSFKRFSWKYCAEITLQAYKFAISMN
jgi:glycosyltransferase involved in cell wall biosynthesis